MERRKQTPDPGEQLDRRVRRTRHALEVNLLELMKSKPLRAISMRELCRAADICRTTPYLHYRDVLDILEQAENAFIIRLDGLFEEYPPERAAQERKAFLCSFYGLVAEHQLLLDVIVNYQGDPDFLEKIAGRCQGHIQAFLPPSIEREPERTYAAAFLTGAMGALLQRYIKEGCAQPAAELAELTPSLGEG